MAMTCRTFMTNEEMERILNYLRDTGQLDPRWHEA